MRVEDTDQARNSQEAVEVIFRGLRWLGLDWDEGPDGKGGTHGEKGPYFQSQRGAIYAKYLEKLQATGRTYEEGGALKFKMPKTPGVVKDLVCGDVTFDRTMEPDLVIRRKDGSPVFHLVNVIDDLEMGITHVIRGEDHLSNTHKHIALYEALGAPAPQFAHIPLILNKGGSKMSKRDDGAALSFYEEAGYLPEAVRNYLCLLGWSPGANEEILPLAEIVKRFELKELNRSNARFDAAKLFWMNGEYWRSMKDLDFTQFAGSFLEKNRPAASALPDSVREGTSARDPREDPHGERDGRVVGSIPDGGISLLCRGEKKTVLQSGQREATPGHRARIPKQHRGLERHFGRVDLQENRGRQSTTKTGAGDSPPAVGCLGSYRGSLSFPSVDCFG